VKSRELTDEIRELESKLSESKSEADGLQGKIAGLKSQVAETEKSFTLRAAASKSWRLPWLSRPRKKSPKRLKPDKMALFLQIKPNPRRFLF